ncbi:hypothetical protein OG194_00235 [Streptomyces sp. NBC_01288]|uniref:hypothetical protein n=1 Tax=Streptomyces sp. NBC_01288 TaxID=2903814 RepID=UPI002E101E4C|nr:hypothetical protein OG194_00235 [Streptomyces sp. NBC_01288]
MSKGSDDLTFGQKVVGRLIAAINNTHVEVFNSHAVGGATDSAAQDLLDSVRELRADLGRLRGGFEIAALEEVLASVEDEITRTGHASASQRDRLRQALADTYTLTSVLASAGAVAAQVGM